jgi:phage protein U
MIGLLGDVTFGLITYFTGVSQEQTANYASLERIGQKPLLQFTGFGADTYKLDMLFHARFCDPQAEIDKLKGMLSSKKSGGLVLTNGTHAGWFVCDSISITSTQMTTDGNLVQATVSVSLTESPPLPIGETNGDISHPANAIGDKPKLTDDGKGMTIAKALSTARTAMSAVNRGIAFANALKSGNPSRVLGQMPGLANDAVKAANALGIDTSGISSEDLKYVANMSKSGIEMVNISNIAQNMNPSNIEQGIQAMHGSMQTANSYMSGVSPWYAKNIANAVARK